MAPPNTDEDPPDSIDELWASLPKEGKRIVCNYLVNFSGPGLERFFSTAIRLIHDKNSSRNAMHDIESGNREASASLSTPKLITREATTGDLSDKFGDSTEGEASLQAAVSGDDAQGAVSEASSALGHANSNPTGVESSTSAPPAPEKTSLYNVPKVAKASVCDTSSKSRPLPMFGSRTTAAGTGLFGSTAPSSRPAAEKRDSRLTLNSNLNSTSASAKSAAGSGSNLAQNLLGNPFLPLPSSPPQTSAGPRPSGLFQPSTASGSPKFGLFGTILAPNQSKTGNPPLAANTSNSGFHATSAPCDLGKTSQSLFGGSATANLGGSGSGVFGKAAPVAGGTGVPSFIISSGLFKPTLYNAGSGSFSEGPSTGGTDGKLAKSTSDSSVTVPKASSSAPGTCRAITGAFAGGNPASRGTGSIFGTCSTGSDLPTAMTASELNTPSVSNTQFESPAPTSNASVSGKRKNDEIEDTNNSSKKIRMADTSVFRSSEATNANAIDFASIGKASTPGGNDVNATQPPSGASYTAASSSDTTTCQPYVSLFSNTAGSSVAVETPKAGCSVSTAPQRQGTFTSGSLFSSPCGIKVQPFSADDTFTRPSSGGATAVNSSTNIKNGSHLSGQSNGSETTAGPSTVEPREDVTSAEGSNTESATQFAESDVDRKFRESLLLSANYRMFDQTFLRNSGSPPDSTRDHFIVYREQEANGAIICFQSNHFWNDFRQFSFEEARLADYDRGQRWGSFLPLPKPQSPAPVLPVHEIGSSSVNTTLSGAPSGPHPIPQSAAAVVAPRLLRCVDCKKIFDPATNDSSSRQCYRHSSKSLSLLQQRFEIFFSPGSSDKL